MSAKLVVAGIVGGIVLFTWGAMSHVVLGLGSAGVKSIPNEDIVLAALRANIDAPGFYFFPGVDMKAKGSKEEQAARMKAWEEKLRAGPTGILVYQPTGNEAMEVKRLLIELLSNIAAALIAAFLLSHMIGGYGLRVVAVTLLGVLASVTIDVSYWNWYRFPGNYMAFTFLDQLIAWFLAGLVMAAMVPSRRAPA